MLKIRMQRVGRINMPAYRLIVAEHTRGPKTGNFVEVVGTYEPKSKARSFKEDRIKYWISVGAKPSATVHNMLVSAGILTGKKINILPRFNAPEVSAETPASSEIAAASGAAAAESAETTVPETAEILADEQK
ncbi:MAG TPA: 30S ribosomal protein S16 [Candidatus Paceibacterota bacterium]|nr:30S ribosomal protein S16 [Candidatus Paceibacterota bacterium]